ncbi:MAG: hypothetical protein CSA31_00650 [Desulfobulbus propionicus]|nr:MAG: hypothetical protein CSA31_00650 [Desulfobulbus propionicus]
MSRYSLTPLSFDGLNTYSLHDRHSKVGFKDFSGAVEAGMTITDLINSLPAQLAALDFSDLVRRTACACKAGKTIILGMGAHVIKVGLNPVVITLMKKGVLSALTLNGAGIIHDTEIAMTGRTSEDVAEVLGAGAFGAAEETGRVLNDAIVKGDSNNLGLGEAVGAALCAQKFPYNNYSLLATAYELNLPVTVHVAMGTDIIHIHPGMDGAATGRAGHRDFRLFGRLISTLQEGVYLNVGSAVLLPEVFLKALTVVRNLGHQVDNFTTANFDFIRQYRPMTNVVHRPHLGGGKGINLTGHHEIMIPLFTAALLDAMER